MEKNYVTLLGGSTNLEVNKNPRRQVPFKTNTSPTLIYTHHPMTPPYTTFKMLVIIE